MKGEWDYFTGTLETLGLHFVGEDGQPIPVAWPTNTGTLQVFNNDGEHCADGWVHKYDIAHGGIIFNYQDSTSLTNWVYCGSAVFALAILEAEPPSPPFYAVNTYEHTNDSGSFQNASFSFDSERRKVSLNVQYGKMPQRWQRESLTRYESRP